MRRHWREFGALAVLGFCVVAVIARVLFDPDGRLSRDSTEYLRIAFEMARGNWLWRAEAAQGEALMSYWAVWPPGYPMAIAGVSQGFSVDVFVASKLVSLICFALSAAALFRFFGHTGALAALLLANASTLTIFSFSWSEGPFILVLVLLAITTSKALEEPKTTVLGHLILPFALCVLLFEIRYAGIFSVGVLLVAAALVWRRSRRSAVFLGLAGAAAVLVFLAHIQINIDRTGYPTGLERIPAPESHLELLRGLFAALLHELLLPITSNYYGRLYWFVVALQVALLVWLAACALKAPKETSPPPAATRASGFLLVGGLYLAAIIFLRWRGQFDPFGLRLLNPGVLLLLIYLLNAALLRCPQLVTRAFLSLACLGILSGLWIAREAAWQRDGPGYFATTEDRLERYADLAPDTILVLGDEKLRYLRPDIHVVEPDYTPYYRASESWADFRARLRPGLPVVIDAVNTSPWRGYDPAFVAFLGQQEEGALIPVDDAVDARIEALGRD